MGNKNEHSKRIFNHFWDFVKRVTFGEIKSIFREGIKINPDDAYCAIMQNAKE